MVPKASPLTSARLERLSHPAETVISEGKRLSRPDPLERATAVHETHRERRDAAGAALPHDTPHFTQPMTRQRLTRPGASMWPACGGMPKTCTRLREWSGRLYALCTSSRRSGGWEAARPVRKKHDARHACATGAVWGTASDDRPEACLPRSA